MSPAAKVPICATRTYTWRSSSVAFLATPKCVAFLATPKRVALGWKRRDLAKLASLKSGWWWTGQSSYMKFMLIHQFFPGFFSCQKVSLPHFWDHVELNVEPTFNSCLEGVILGMPPKLRPLDAPQQRIPKITSGFDSFNLRVSFDDTFWPLKSQIQIEETFFPPPPEMSSRKIVHPDFRWSRKFSGSTTRTIIFLGGQPLVFLVTQVNKNSKFAPETRPKLAQGSDLQTAW